LKLSNDIKLKRLKKIPSHILEFLNNPNKSDIEKLKVIENYTNNWSDPLKL